MHLKQLEISGFKSFAKKTSFDFDSRVVGIVGPNGSGKSNVAESIRFVLGEQSMKSMRGKRGEDMIWNGSNQVPRMSRASVSITFDNASRFLNIDFDEVIIERVVHRDGTNEYRLNGSTVRLKDILELLAGANIGQTGHHIISQGEADKILAASPKDRREMLEDALGLKVFQYKKDESTRKLERTEENMRQVEALRREVAPHLRFLRKQVEKIQKAETLREEAKTRFAAFFAREDAYLQKEKRSLEVVQKEKKVALESIVGEVNSAKQALADAPGDVRAKEIVRISDELEAVRGEKNGALRTAARLEGQIEALQNAGIESTISAQELSRLIEEAEAEMNSARTALDTLVSFAQNLLQRLRSLMDQGNGAKSEIESLQKQRVEAQEKEQTLSQKESALARELENIRKELDDVKAEERDQERLVFELTARERDVRHELSMLQSQLDRLSLEEDEFKRELTEAATLIGREVLRYENHMVDEISRDEQEKEKRELQKIKIRIEEMGAGGGDDVLREFKEAQEREEHLEKELTDLETSKESLKTLITELDEELRARFKEGLTEINTQFSHFFSLMFDGGSASLVLTKEPVRRPRSLEDEDDNGIPDDMEKTIEGIDISLTIPRKRIRSLTMLSGGERALTSIALIFAMSSVNPPPFVVLDETDAALDEANSRRYGDMVEQLAKKSQLVVITHNRETMSRAGILYGVTMGDSGVSKVLSVKLEEAVQVAK